MMDNSDASSASTATGRRIAIPLEQWPAVDRDAWVRALQPGGFLDEDGRAADWRPATRHSAINTWGRFLSYLQQQKMLYPQEGPAERIRPDIIGGYVAFLRAHRSSTTVASYIGVLEMMIQALAPGDDWSWLRRLQARLQRRAVPSRDKRSRIVRADELLRLGLDLMTAAETIAIEAPLKAALGFRDGVMIALLATRPLRQRNFLGMAIGKNLLASGNGYQLHFAAGETKTGRALDFSVPVGLVAALRRYLDQYRPFLLGLRATRGRTRQTHWSAPGPIVWLNQYGSPCSPSAQRKALEKHTVARFGHFVNAHLFRDCVATTVATEDPEHVRITAQLLGHGCFQTTQRNYIVADSLVAMTSYHDLISSMRKDAKGPRRAGR